MVPSLACNLSFQKQYALLELITYISATKYIINFYKMYIYYIFLIILNFNYIFCDQNPEGVEYANKCEGWLFLRLVKFFNKYY